MPGKDDPEPKCPACHEPMSVLKRIAHDDRSATIYWRCSGCSHIEVVRTAPR